MLPATMNGGSMLETMQRRTRAAPDAAGTIWYMGAKTRLLRDLERAIGPLLVGPRPVLIDLFAGTGVVGAHFADRARVVAADAQEFSAVLARALLRPAPGAAEGLERVLARARREAAAVERRFARAVAAERRFLDEGLGTDGAVVRYRAWLEGELAAHRPEEEAAEGLVAAYYRNVYFGVGQAAALDGLRRAIDAEGEPERTAYLAALVFAASRATSATAHFAQPRGLRKPSELRAMLARRRIDVRALFAARVRWLARAGERVALPAENDVRALPYRDLFARLAPPEPRAVEVVYADPPYTQDQYSRFYHVLEVLCGYRPPALARNARGEVLKGRYPRLERRFQSCFCGPESVEGEFRRVSALSAARGAALVWSYSRTNGLLLKLWAGDVARFRRMLEEYYATVDVRERPLRHSGQGDKNHDAVEIIAVCTRPHGAAPKAP